MLPVYLSAPQDAWNTTSATYERDYVTVPGKTHISLTYGQRL